MPCALQADKLGDVLKVLAKNVLIASGEDRHGADAELEQLFQSRWIVHDINRREVDAFLRKKLFRLQATASTRLSEQNKFVGDVFHNRMLAIDESKIESNVSPPNALVGGPFRTSPPGFPLKACGNDGLRGWCKFYPASCKEFNPCRLNRRETISRRNPFQATLSRGS
jgi:hypothetical protein